MTVEKHETAPSVSAGRPKYHFIAPQGWMNDPCAPGYDPSTGLYHMFYQWSPATHYWHDISWGHATSKDMLNWDHDSQDRPVFVPDQPYDCKGIFTGCFHPAGPAGEKGDLSVFYTSVKHLPISWDIPYTRGCEGLAMATSKDGGKTWCKRTEPVLLEEPAGLDVTGFRDPYVAEWPSMDALRGTSSMLYGIISGGEHGLGPRTYLYAIDPNDLTNWTYLHPLTNDLPINHVPSTRWSGDFGRNWECSNFFTLLDSSGKAFEVFIAGSEGGEEQSWVTKHRKLNPDNPKRVPRYSNWTMGQLVKREDDEVRLEIRQAGLLDCGVFYAATSFVAPDGRRILWGWMIEEDLPDVELKQRGWTGCFGVPRELFVQTITGVVGALRADVETISSVDAAVSPEGYTVSTLGMRPLAELAELDGELLFDHPPSTLKPSLTCLRDAPLSCRIEATLHVFDRTESVSLILRHSDEMTAATTITFDCREERLIVDRSKSTQRPDINTAPEIGSHTLYRIADKTSGSGVLEPLKLTVFVDHDVIEVFANDRFAISTRVYTDARHTGISLASVGGGWVEKLAVWQVEGARGSG